MQSQEIWPDYDGYAQRRGTMHIVTNAYSHRRRPGQGVHQEDHVAA